MNKTDVQFNPLIIIPSYNTGGELLLRTMTEVLMYELPVMLIIDGSGDGSTEVIKNSLENPLLRIIEKPSNTGKGDSVRHAAILALKGGYTHALIMDADGQHPASSIPPMLDLAKRHTSAVVMGQPVFGHEAPMARVYGRKITSFWTSLETLWCGLGDTLFGMRIYPLVGLLNAFAQTSFARGFDFDPEIAVRMSWLGYRPIRYDVPVRYLTQDEGGISHFHYFRDNFKLTLLHFRLVPEFLLFRIIPFIAHLRKWEK